VRKRRENFAEENLQAAAIILANPERYGGAGSLAVIRARRIKEKAQTAAKAVREGSTLGTASLQ
jgi:hypothetical protein